MGDVLGIKKTQLNSVRDPNVSLIEKLEYDTGGVKALAKQYLISHKISLE